MGTTFLTGQTRPNGNLPPASVRALRELCVDGASNKEIAKRMGITEQTVKFHLSAALEYSQCANRTALALWWIRRGQYFVDDDDG